MYNYIKGEGEGSMMGGGGGWENLPKMLSIFSLFL